MKNQNKANAGRTQIADISVAGNELSEEHFRIVGGGLLRWLVGSVQTHSTCVAYKTCTFADLGNCLQSQTDGWCCSDAGPAAAS